MKKTIFIIALSIFSIATISSFADRGSEYSSEDQGSDDHDSNDLSEDNAWLAPRADIQTVQNEQYISECGACHFAYQPGLLPQSAWARIMGSLENHFDDDASLAEQQTSEIRDFLFKYAADHANSSRSRAFAAGSPSNEALPRITHTRYFRREHSEIPSRFVRDNPDVGSFSNCQACHGNADTGIYNEHQVVIPGVGKWDD